MKPYNCLLRIIVVLLFAGFASGENLAIGNLNLNIVPRPASVKRLTGYLV